ncbi:hypothetical protein [Streptomyces sp. NL15-2K]|uniref:hypothetical protein n=1 Tax=Streptomyces sp. NL15-2K TaxID=376149 RepID=UPI000F559E23|nr:MULTISPECIES: hypothetical protein [Actinomycetes]WKX11073.1 hypothetical protein Q4V64_27610 [Kutzneria buriramensis]GCB47445.1 hypothetical protein SNL152K_4750 [Streptomyces sp. NL15-2K]
MGPLRRSLRAAITAAALFSLTVSCTDDEPQSPPTTDSPSSNTPSRSLPPTTSPTPTPTASAPEDPAEAEKQVRDAWARFFGPETSVEDKADVMESGDEYQLMIDALANDPKTHVLRVRVDSVTFTSDLHARIGYTLFSGDRKVGPDGPGASVRQDDTWKVSAKTVCSLTKYGKDVPQAPIC